MFVFSGEVKLAWIGRGGSTVLKVERVMMLLKRSCTAVFGGFSGIFPCIVCLDCQLSVCFFFLRFFFHSTGSLL